MHVSVHIHIDFCFPNGKMNTVKSFNDTHFSFSLFQTVRWIFIFYSNIHFTERSDEQINEIELSNEKLGARVSMLSMHHCVMWTDPNIWASKWLDSTSILKAIKMPNDECLKRVLISVFQNFVVQSRKFL